MRINVTPKKIILAVCTVAMLAAGGMLYMNQAAGGEPGVTVNRANGSEAPVPETGTSGDGEGAGAGVEGSAASSEGKSGDDGATEGQASGVDIYVDVAGAVKNPGVVIMGAGSRVFQAIEAAGGEMGGADTSAINLAAAVNDGDHIYVPTKEETASGAYLSKVATGSSGDSSATGSNPGSSASVSGKININTADSAALQQLNGVGPSTAQKIIDYRSANGNFKTIEALKDVSGIGDKTFEKLKDHICV